MPDPFLYLKAMGSAAIVSALFVLAITGSVCPASTRRQNSACVLGTGLGLAVGLSVLPLRLAWPPVNGLDRLFVVVVPAALAIELVAGFRRVPRWVAWLMRVFLAASIPRILLHGSVYLSRSGGDWALWQCAAELMACSALLLGMWVLLSWLSERSPGVSIPFALALTIQCSGLTIMMAGYIKGGVAAFLLAAALVGTTLGSCLMMKRTSLSAIIGIGAVELFGVVFVGRFFGRLSTSCALAMLLVPLLCLASETPFLRHRPPWFVGTLRLSLVAISLAVMLVLATQHFDREMAPLLSETNLQTEAADDDEREIGAGDERVRWANAGSALRLYSAGLSNNRFTSKSEVR